MKEKTISVVVLILFTICMLPTVVYANSSTNDQVRSINHRGYCTIAPENTLPAFELSSKKGFSYVEADISFTKDNVPVLLHDSTINRTARNSDGSKIVNNIAIGDITYAEAIQYDYGIWKSSSYKGTVIPTFSQFLELCKKHKLHPYIELKSNGAYDKNQITMLVDMVHNEKLNGNVTWISFNHSYLSWIRDSDPNARLGFLSYCILGQETILLNKTKELRTSSNDVFLDIMYTTVNSTLITQCKRDGMPLEVWTIDTIEQIRSLDPYISGITTNAPKYEDAAATPWVPSKSDETTVNPSQENQKVNTWTCSGIKVTQPKNKLKISWKHENGISKYGIFVTYVNKKFKKEPSIVTTNSSSTIIKINGKLIDNSKDYKLYIVAYNSDGDIIGKSVTCFVAGKTSPNTQIQKQ